eukprot:scaffold38990_cov26-Tisochrysis_lutea.AAC.7
MAAAVAAAVAAVALEAELAALFGLPDAGRATVSRTPPKHSSGILASLKRVTTSSLSSYQRPAAVPSRGRTYEK